MIRLIVFSLLLVILTSCSDGLDKELDIVPFKESRIVSTSQIDENSNKNENIEVNLEPITPVYGEYLSGPPMDWFSKIIKDNPIDKDYENENSELQNSTGFNTTAWIELEDKFSRTWDNELNYIYEQLLNKLNSENKESLIKAQRGWLQYHTNEIEFAEHFINFPDEKGPLLGTQGYINTYIAKKERIRKRTIQLYEYYFLQNEKIEFYYKSKA